MGWTSTAYPPDLPPAQSQAHPVGLLPLCALSDGALAPYYTTTNTIRTTTMDLLQLVKGFNEILWNNFLMYVLLGVGIFYTIYLGVPQIRHFSLAMKYSFGSIF